MSSCVRDDDSDSESTSSSSTSSTSSRSSSSSQHELNEVHGSADRIVSILRSAPLPFAAPVPFQPNKAKAKEELPNGESDNDSSNHDSSSSDEEECSNSKSSIPSSETASVHQQGQQKGLCFPFAAAVPFQPNVGVKPRALESSSDSDSGSESSSSDEEAPNTFVTTSGQQQVSLEDPAPSGDVDNNGGNRDDNNIKGKANAKSDKIPPDEIEKKKKKPFWSAKPIVFVKGLPFSTNLSEIKNFFGCCGNISKVDRQFDDNKRWTGSIFIKFDSATSVENALAMNGSVWSGTGGDGKRFVTVDKHDQKKGAKRRQKTKKGSNHSVFIGNLRKDIEKQDIQDLFVECGTIKGIRFAKDTNGECRGFGYIEFDTENGKENALTMNRKFTLQGNQIQVKKAQNNSSNRKPPKTKEDSDRKDNKNKKRTSSEVKGSNKQNNEKKRKTA